MWSGVETITRVEGVAELGEHLAEVREVRHAGELRIRLGEARGVHVAEADVFRLRVRADFGDVGEPLAIAADGDNLQIRVRIRRAQDGRKAEHGGGGGFEEGATGGVHGCERLM